MLGTGVDVRSCLIYVTNTLITPPTSLQPLRNSGGEGSTVVPSGRQRPSRKRGGGCVVFFERVVVTNARNRYIFYHRDLRPRNCDITMMMIASRNAIAIVVGHPIRPPSSTTTRTIASLFSPTTQRRSTDPAYAADGRCRCRRPFAGPRAASPSGGHGFCLPSYTTRYTSVHPRARTPSTSSTDYRHGHR